MSVTNKLTPELEELIVSLRLTLEGNRKSTRQISGELKEMGHDISHVTVSKVLKGHTEELREKSRELAFSALEGTVPKDVAITNELLHGVMQVWRKGQPQIDENGKQIGGVSVVAWNGLTKQAVSIIAMRMTLAGITNDGNSGASESDLSNEELEAELARVEAVIETNRRLN